MTAGSLRARKIRTPMNLLSLGIDIAQLTFVAALRLDVQRFVKQEFANDERGFRKLRVWLKRHGAGKVRAAVESTNTYAEALLQWLYTEGHEVFLLNAERLFYYGRLLGQRNKTDPSDAVTIATFIALHDATPWQPPSPEQKTLRSLTRVRYQLVCIATQLACQRKTADATARAHLDPLLAKVRDQLKQIAREIAAHLKAHPAIEEQVRRLMTVKGVGLITAAIIIAELPPITPQSDPRTICGWAGLTPRRRQSGKVELPAKLSRKGNAYVRDALYMPALVAKRYNPVLQAFATRLKANGKTNQAILGAVAHKMLRIFVGLLKSKTDFDPHWSLQKG